MAETKQATTPKNKGGRQTRLTPAIFAAIVEAVGGGLPLPYVPGLIGVPGSTFRAWIREGRRATAGRCCDLVRAINAAESDMVGRCLATIKKAAETDWRAQRWLLERYDPQQFGNPKTMESIVRDELNLLRSARRREEKEKRKQAERQANPWTQFRRDPKAPPEMKPDDELWGECPLTGRRRRAIMSNTGSLIWYDYWDDYKRRHPEATDPAFPAGEGDGDDPPTGHTAPLFADDTDPFT